MIGDWLGAALRGRALKQSTREVEGFVAALEAMEPSDLGTLLAIATVVRINMEQHGVLPEGALFGMEPPSREALGRYQLRLNKHARDFARMGLDTDSVATLVWSYSMRCLNVDDLRPLGRRLWRALARGFPHVEAALARGQAERGAPLPERARSEWKRLPAGFEAG